MIVEGIRLMFIGMGVVFAFLGILVGSMHLTAAFFRRFKHLFPEEAPVVTGPRSAGADETDIAVVLAAVKAFTQG